MKKLSLIPATGRLIVEPADPESITPGGIVIPDCAKEKPCRGKVLAVHSAADKKPCADEGDTILFARYQGTTIEVEGREVVILKEEDVLAKFA